MQPFWRAITFSDICLSVCVFLMREASTLILGGQESQLLDGYGEQRYTHAPMSFTTTAMRSPWSVLRMCWRSEVLPDP